MIYAWPLLLIVTLMTAPALAQVSDAQLTSFMDCVNLIRKVSGEKPNKTQLADHELLKTVMDQCGVQNAFVPQTGGYKETAKVIADATKRRSKLCDLALANATKVSSAQNKACGGLSFIWIEQPLVAKPMPAAKPVAAVKPLPLTPDVKNHASWKELLELEKSSKVQSKDPNLRACTRIVDDNEMKVAKLCRNNIKSAECTNMLKTALDYIKNYLAKGCPR